MTSGPQSSRTADGAPSTVRPRVAASQRTVAASTDQSGSTSAPVGPLVAVLRRPLLALLPVLLVLTAGVAAVLQRPPTYEAEAQVLVGRVDVESNAVPGFVSATQQLAATYARLVSTTIIAERVAASLDVPVERVQGQLDADPVPESSLIRISTTADSERGAVALAEATSTELVGYLRETNDDPERQRALLDEYEAASAELQNAQLARVAADAALAEASRAELPARQAAAAAARAAVDRAQLRVDTAASAFTDSQRGAADRGALQLVSEAKSLGNDRGRRLQLAVAASLVLGGLLGVGLASLKENRAALQRLRRRLPAS